MPKMQMDDRLKRLFTDLEVRVEPLKGQAVTGHVENDESVKKARFASAHAKPVNPICPFLKTAWDATIRYSYPNEENACHRPQKAQPVSLANQEAYCLGKQHRYCPIYASASTARQNNPRFTSFFQIIKRRLFR